MLKTVLIGAASGLVTLAVGLAVVVTMTPTVEDLGYERAAEDLGWVFARLDGVNLRQDPHARSEFYADLYECETEALELGAERMMSLIRTCMKASGYTTLLEEEAEGLYGPRVEGIPEIEQGRRHAHEEQS